MKPNRKTFFMTVVLATALSLTVAWTCAAAVPDPPPTDLGVLPSYEHQFSKANAINNAGQVVGESSETDSFNPKPFIWQNGEMTPLPLPVGSVEGVAMSINDAGQVAGYCKDGESHFQACLWTQEAGGWVVTALGTPTLTNSEFPDYELTFTSSFAVKINNAGQILAVASGGMVDGAETDDFTSVWAIWQKGTWSFLTDSLGQPHGVSGHIVKMNEDGQVLFNKENGAEVYQDLWVWDGETAIMLVEKINWANLNNFGQIVGRYYNPTNQNQNFTYEIATKTLKTYPVSDGGYSLVNINDNGQVLVAYPTNLIYENGSLKTATTELGITSFKDLLLDTASVTSLGSVDDYVDPHSLNFNVNGEVSGSGYNIENIFYAREGTGVIPLTGLVEFDDYYLQVTAMNDSGVIIGRSQAPDSGAHAVLWGEVAPPVSTLYILIDPSGPVPVNTQITSGAFLSDSQTTDIHTATWDWGDGSTSDGTIDKGNKIVNGEQSYAEPGVYTVGLKIFNSDGNLLNQAVYQYVVVYDPTGGFVTGGGWINSPAGAYKDDPSLEGQATFGFVSRYKKGTTVPTGTTAFEFQAGDLYFQSTGYDWLVVTGSDKASSKGSGIINGGGDYKFMLWAGDGAPDTFRIRIWEEDENTAEEIDIYDNGSDQAINGGSVVIHAK